MAGTLRESMNILRAENQTWENAVETRANFLTREFLQAKSDEFHGGLEPKKAYELLEQTVKTFEMLHIEDSKLRLTLVIYYLKGDVRQWWKYAKGRVEPTWETFVVAFQDKYLPPTARERLRQEFQNLNQLNMSVAEFEAAFSSLSQFASELVATKECRCIEFEKKLRTKILFKVVGNMIRNYDRLVEAVAHVEISVEADEERLQGLRLRGQGSQGDYRPNKKSRNTFSPQSQPQQSRSTFYLPSASPGKNTPSGFPCFKCGQSGHKAFSCLQKGEDSKCCHHHHHLTDPRVSLRVEGKDLLAISVVNWGT
ncbi:uncharacterized protein LOC114285009 [Camellia sinensis]|uniref:uncharacterized protein LOC114285009 n=1 Tax=Camellia sinensis TaxID=4442 RepID=UPI001036E3F0|nr:uncharacterized protein LOC114285009 [Camellia sinensis]